ncbi:hypothetical protein FRC0414_00509 [Corynebacterium diphtheriae]|nr:hypothetical protein FRC0414_00509 [Corynebacterium diphtheriae]
MIPPKPFVEHKDLLDGLASTNLRIKNRELGLLSLRKIGYHRLAGYRYLFREFYQLKINKDICIHFEVRNISGAQALNKWLN